MIRSIPPSDMRMKRTISTSVVALGLGVAVPAQSALVDQANLVTDDQSVLAGLGFDPAVTVDPLLINPWGMSFAPTGPFWVSNQGTGTATLYNGAGAKVPLTVNTPQNATGPAGPTGQVFNGTSSFALPTGGPGLFFFANLDGSIAGWNPAQSTNSVQVVPASTAGRPAVYTGLALGMTGGNDFLYAANNLSGTVDVFDTAFNKVSLTGAFVDPGANPGGFAPFNVHTIGDKLWVTYATPGPGADEAPLGSGFVSIFNMDGTFVERFAEGGQLLSPWGVALAPSSFADFAGAVLIGNFAEEDGLINAFRLSDGTFLGSLRDRSGEAIEIPYLWTLTFGNGGMGGDVDKLYFTAGIGDEEHGLLGRFTIVPEPGQWLLMLGGFTLLGMQIRRRRVGRRVAS